MEEKKIKKKKQTLTVSIKKPIDVSRYSQDKGKTSVVIDKKISKRRNERRFYNRENNIGWVRKLPRAEAAEQAMQYLSG